MNEVEPTPAESAASVQVEQRKARAPKRGGRSMPMRAWLGRSSLRAASHLSYPAAYRLGGAIGRSLASLPTPEKRATLVNLEMCMPELDEPARATLMRASLVETGRTFAEFGAMWCWPGERALGLVKEVVGLESYERARSSGRGAILLTPHLGAWELCGLYFSSRAPLTAMYKRPPVQEMEEFYCAARGRLGARLAPADAGGVATLLRALKSGEVVGILPDQDPGRGAGVFVPYFGVLANTTTLVAKLAARSRAPVLLVWAERLPRGAGFRIHVVEPARVIGVDDPIAGTVALNLEIEELVRTRPTQYLWSYKRFRSRPAGLGNPYREGVSARTVGERTVR